MLREEREERAMGEAEMWVRKGENVVGFAEEIKARVRRTWFVGEGEKRAARGRGAVELNGAEGKKVKKEGRLSGKDRKRLDDGRERREGKTWKKGREERGGGGKDGGVAAKKGDGGGRAVRGGSKRGSGGAIGSTGGRGGRGGRGGKGGKGIRR